MRWRGLATRYDEHATEAALSTTFEPALLEQVKTFSFRGCTCRPMGYVAWAGDLQPGLADALTTWFGPPTAA